jgi:hypothetical protein
MTVVEPVSRGSSERLRLCLGAANDNLCPGFAVIALAIHFESGQGRIG